VIRPALAEAGLPHCRVHDLRHTFAALQLSAGVHYMQVSKWMGHATYVITLTTYGEWIPEDDGGVPNALPEPVAGVPGTNVISLFGEATNCG